MSSSTTVWQRYLLPSVTFMSVVIGGGYATGRELVEFFMPSGAVGGLLGMLVTAALWSIVFALSLELARATRSFDYRSFFQMLIGRGWVLFELAYLALMVLILAVLGAACGGIVADIFAAPEWLGSLLFLISVAVLAWSGTAAIEKFFSLWGVLLYAAYITFFVVCLDAFHEPIATAVVSSDLPEPSLWILGGLAYAGYNSVAAPALLFCARHQQRRRESLISGLLAGPVAILPGALFFIAMQARSEPVMDAPIPLQVLLGALQMPWLNVAMQIAIFGTLVQTGIGILHGFNERIFANRSTGGSGSRALRLAVSLGLSSFAIVLAARIGLVDLIARGYGYLSWVFIAVYMAPLLTIGVWRLWKRDEPEQLPATAGGQ